MAVAVADVTALPPNEVHVFFACTDQVRNADALQALLSADETARMRRFFAAANAHEYLVAHALLRLALSRFAAVEPLAWMFRPQEFGRPVVAGPAGAPPLTFSLSHTKGLVACAVAYDRQVGVDVEWQARATDGLGIAEQFFSRAEVAWLRAQPAPQQPHSFLQLWTLKEAYLKARGVGLALPLDGFSFAPSADGDIGLSFSQSIDDDPARWQFLQQCPSPAHVLAVAAHVQPDQPVHIAVNPWTL
ncbi:MAG: 4'-phosphopantetheinyl transferase superfamily protein [Deltaproteobacteria bacterium]|nr:4'-phosphopantetheinyl transferase superfamily protein [Deltaproteobacteria bacterium]